MKRKYRSKAHNKHLILYHIIFVAKYRRKFLSNARLTEELKNRFLEISKKYQFEIESVEIDPSKPDHVHFLVRSIPNVSPAQIVRVLKQEATTWCWDNWESWLKKFYWGTRHIFTRGYFCGSVGNVSADDVAAYLEAQSGRGKR